MAARGEGAVDKWWRGNEISGVLEPRQGEWYKVRTQLPIPNTYLLRQKKGEEAAKWRMEGHYE